MNEIVLYAVGKYYYGRYKTIIDSEAIAQWIIDTGFNVTVTPIHPEYLEYISITFTDDVACRLFMLYFGIEDDDIYNDVPILEQDHAS